MRYISDIVPEPDALLALEPEELAGVVLEYLNSLPSEERRRKLHTQNFGQLSTVDGYPEGHKPAIRRALMEAWVWLMHEGLLAPRPGEGDWLFITRRGRSMSRAGDLAAYRRQSMLPRKFLQARIAQKVWATFLRGDYDTAVFQAFKEVEVAVREACGLPPEVLGTDLMRRAFNAESGPLRDRGAPAAERQALAHLFAGAVGSYKNPHSHRNVAVESEEAAEMIMLASHLLKIVDARAPNDS